MTTVAKLCYCYCVASGSNIICTIIKTTRLSVTQAVSVTGWPVILTGWLASWLVTVSVVKMGAVSQPGADAERYRCACLQCTRAGWAW